MSFYSCGDKKEPTPEEVIDSTLLKPKIEFSYQLLDSGGVKFTNKSKNIVSSKWWVTWYRSKETSPTFYFESDARYNFQLRIVDNKGRENDTTFYLYIEKTPKIKIDSFSLKGIIFDKEFNLNAIGRNDFYGVGLASLPLGTPSARFQESGVSIMLADFMTVQGKDYQTMKSNFKLGNQTLAQLKTYPTGDYSRNIDGWYFLLTGQYGTYASGNASTDSLKILEVEEFKGRKLYPEMDERGFWITWHFKAETDKGKIDCILKTKYIIYKTYIPF